MGRISALTELTSLASDDYLLVLDSSANIAKKITVANAFGIPDYGWTTTGETWTYSSWSSTTRIGVITVPTDATTKYTPGMRIRISQSTGGTKYGIIHAVTSTTLSVFFPSGTTLNNETISTPYYSSLKTPFGFDADPTNWKLEIQDSNNRAPTASSTYVSFTTALTVGIGAWNMFVYAPLSLTISGANNRYGHVTASTDGVNQTHPSLTVGCRYSPSGTSTAGTQGVQSGSTGFAQLTSEQTFTLIGKVGNTTGVTSFSAEGSFGSVPIIIRAISAYL